MAVDRAHVASLNQLLKVHSAIAARRAAGQRQCLCAKSSVVQVLANLGEDELRALDAGGARENETPYGTPARIR